MTYQMRLILRMLLPYFTGRRDAMMVVIKPELFKKFPSGVNEAVRSWLKRPEQDAA